MHGIPESVRLLLEAKADKTFRDGAGKTPLDLAKWQLNNHQTHPCNPPEATQRLIFDLQRVIKMLDNGS